MLNYLCTERHRTQFVFGLDAHAHVVLLYTRSGDATSPHLAMWHIYIRQKKQYVFVYVYESCMHLAANPAVRPALKDACDTGPTSRRLRLQSTQAAKIVGGF